jgi:hypothetical protein
VSEARFFITECLPRNEALAQLQNSQLSEQKPGFTEQTAACTILPENATKVN